MKSILIAALTALLFSGASRIAISQDSPSTQAPTAARAQTNDTPRVAPGSVIPVQLSKTVDAKKAKSGDEVVAQITSDMKSNSGEVLLPKGTKVIGHVTVVQARSKEQKDSELGIAFDHAVLKNGTQMQMPASIQAVIAPPSSNPGNGGGYDQSGGPGAAPGGSSAGGGHYPGMGGTAGSRAGGAAPSGAAGDSDAGASAAGPITASTQGVVGISDLKLAAAPPNSTQGALITSEKNNVKLESGTLMLLHVNQ